MAKGLEGQRRRDNWSRRAARARVPRRPGPSRPPDSAAGLQEGTSLILPAASEGRSVEVPILQVVKLFRRVGGPPAPARRWASLGPWMV